MGYMSVHNKDTYSAGSIKKDLLNFLKEISDLTRLSIPITAALSLEMFKGVIDTIMIAPLGTESLAAVSLTESISIIFYAASAGFVGICGIFAANNFGGKNNELLASTLKSGLVLALLVGPLFTGMMISFWYFLPSLRQPQEVLSILPYYWIIMSIIMIPHIMLMTIKSVYDAINKPWIGLLLICSGIIVKVIANWIFIYGVGEWEGFGLFGAALASMFAKVFALLLAIMYWRLSPKMAQYRCAARVSWVSVLDQFKKAAPLALGYAGEGGSFAAAGLMVGLFGSTALAANQIVGSVAGILYMTPMGISSAVAIRIGQAIGAGKGKKDLRLIGYASITTVCFWMGLIISGLLIFNDDISNMLSDDPAVIVLAASMFITFAGMQMGDGIQAICLGLLRGLLDLTWPIISTLLAFWVFALPFAYILSVPLGFGPNAIWVGYGAGTVVASIILIWRFLILTKEGRLEANTTQYSGDSITCTK